MSKAGLGTYMVWDSETVAGITEINGVDVTTEKIDATNLLSTGGIKEKKPGEIDVADIILKGNFEESDTAGQHAMLVDQLARSIKTAVIHFPDDIATWTISGFVSKFMTGGAARGGLVSFEAAITPSGGAPVFAVATSTGLTTPFFAISESAVVLPTKSGTVYEYVATVLTGVSSVTVTPTAAAGVITVNGNVVATGVASSAIALGAAGSVTDITIEVTETDKATKTYVIHLARAAS